MSEPITQISKKLGKTEAIKMSHIQRIVAFEYGFSVEDLKHKSRKAKIVHYRHITMYLCNELTYNSLTQIAYAFNRTNHTTIINAINNIEERIKHDAPEFKAQLEALTIKIKATWKLQTQGVPK